jgi:hypothetical protein
VGAVGLTEWGQTHWRERAQDYLFKNRPDLLSGIPRMTDDALNETVLFEAFKRDDKNYPRRPNSQNNPDQHYFSNGTTLHNVRDGPWIDPSRDDDPIPRQTRTASSKPTPPADIIRLRFFSELTQPAPKPWLIKNVIAKGETSSWIAPPGKGKSTLLTDIAVHLAAGRDLGD